MGFLKPAKAMGLEYDCLIVGPGDYRQDFLINPAALEGLLDRIVVGSLRSGRTAGRVLTE